MIPQVKGTIPRSHSNDDVGEFILKRYGVPLVVVSPVSTAVMLAAYISEGRFSIPRNPPYLDFSEIARSNTDGALDRLNTETNLQQQISKDKSAAQVVSTFTLAGSSTTPGAQLRMFLQP